jgi:hypothetical protein
VAINPQKKRRYTFQVVAVETSNPHAAKLRERFYSLHPEVQHKTHPYTAPYPFMPFLPSKEWPIDKIYQLARLHVRCIPELVPIFLHNLQDIRNQTADNGNQLMHGFVAMRCAIPDGSPPEILAPPLLDSIHNTGRIHTKVVLVPKTMEVETLTQFAIMHSILLNNVAEKYHGNVFVDGM